MNIGQIDNGMMKGAWGDYETDKVIVSIIKHHVLITMKAGQWTEKLQMQVRDISTADFECKNSILTKKIDKEICSVLTL